MTTLNGPLPFDPPPSGPTATKALVTPRQRQVIHLVAEGLTNKEIASQLNIAVHTVKTHVHTVLTTLRLRSRLELAVLVYRATRDNVSTDGQQLA
ncbi:MAG TPA: LuxR C-terminal-related transcriptional regulator [Gemmatimonadales bacterium]|nr:LuxR C-terminal-related transcriptional regulator [Gemmatimonadales bacterium]